MSLIKKVLNTVLISINILALVALLIASFSDMVSPYRNIIIPFFGLFFPFIFAGNLLFFFTWVIFRKWKFVLLNFLIFLICGSAIHTYFPINRPTKNVPDSAIKILTYNVMRFNRLQKNKPDDPNQIIQYIKNSQADIVCLQEYSASKKDSKTLTEKDILDALGKDYPYNSLSELQFPYKSEIFGLFIFSKFPILSIEKIPYESKYNGSFIAELDVNGKKVTIVNNHLESNKLSAEERNNYYRLTHEIDSESLNAFSKVMYERLSTAYKARALQVQLISKIIKENKNPYVIVCGDFNDTPISYTRHKIKGDLKDAFMESGSGLGITFNRHRFLFRIDYILHSKNIKSYNCTVGKLKDSDHYPVSCYLELK